MPALKPWQIIPVPPPTLPSSTVSLADAQGRVDVLRVHALAADVVEEAVERLADDR